MMSNPLDIPKLIGLVKQSLRSGYNKPINTINARENVVRHSYITPNSTSTSDYKQCPTCYRIFSDLSKHKCQKQNENNESGDFYVC